MPTSEELYKQASELPSFNREKAYAEWQSGQKPFLEAVMNNYERPVQQITPEQEKKIKFASAITDSMTSLAELFGHGQGARIKPRSVPSNQLTTNQRLEAFRKKFEDDTARYDDRRMNAGMMDFQDYVRQAQEARGEKRQSILLDAQRAEAAEQRATQRAQKLEDEARLRKQEKEDYSWKMELNDQYDKKQVARRKTYSGGGGGSYSGSGGTLPRGYVNLQDSRGNYVQMHKDAWINASQEIYGELTRRGIIPKLTVDSKDAMGMPIKQEIRTPNQVAAYVSQNAEKIPDDLWQKLYSRSRGEAYTAAPGQQQRTSTPSGEGKGTANNNDPLGIYQ